MTQAPDPAAATSALVDAWLADRSVPLACPACGGGPVTVTDASARPHAEWYLVDCARCGHHATVHRALGRPRSADG